MPSCCPIRRGFRPGFRDKALGWVTSRRVARDMRRTRRLAAIIAADVARYSRLIEADEEGTLSRLRSIRTELIELAVAEHRGRIVKTTGGFLIEFPSVVDALR